MLPILALGAAALFLMKKKGTPSTNGNGTNGNGNGTNGANGTGTNGNGTNGNGANGDGEDTSVIKEPGLYDMKVNETVTILPTSGEFYLAGNVWVNGAKSEGTQFKSGVGYILMENEVETGPYLANKTISLTFRPLKKGTFVLHPTLFTGTPDYHRTDDVEYTFIVT